MPVHHEGGAVVDAQVLDLDAVLPAEVPVAEVGEGLDVADALGAAPASLREGGVDADDLAQDVLAELLRLLVEAAGLQGADGGIERRDGEDDPDLAVRFGEADGRPQVLE